MHINCITGVLKWWVATQKWVAGPEFLTLDSMRAPKFRHKRWVASRLSLRTNAVLYNSLSRDFIFAPMRFKFFQLKGVINYRNLAKLKEKNHIMLF
jgi:hypothetical protein